MFILNSIVHSHISSCHTIYVC